MDVKPTPGKKVREYFLEPPKPFSKKRDLNKKRVVKCASLGLGIVLIIVLFTPSTPTGDVAAFSEQVEAKVKPSDGPTSDVPLDPLLSTLQESRGFGGPRVPTYGSPYESAGGGTSQNRNTQMILVREGFDSKTQLQPGTRLLVAISERILVGTNTMPVRGRVVADAEQDGDVAIPKDATLLGDVSFDEYSDRANISWKSVIYPDGKQRDLAAIGASQDGDSGVEGRVHSEAVKNTIGQALTRFVGAYAEGAITRNQTGGSAGGADNGWKNAVAETAKERANIWAEDLKKVKRWIELEQGTRALAIITQPFRFRDPGSVR